MEPKYQLGPIPNFKDPQDKSRFYVAHKTARTYVAIVPRDGFSFTPALEGARTSAWWISQDTCPYSVDAIIEVLDREDGANFAQTSWRIHPANIPVDYDDLPAVLPVGYVPPYEDFGSW